AGQVQPGDEDQVVGEVEPGPQQRADDDERQGGGGKAGSGAGPAGSFPAAHACYGLATGIGSADTRSTVRVLRRSRNRATTTMSSPRIGPTTGTQNFTSSSCRRLLVIRSATDFTVAGVFRKLTSASCRTFSPFRWGHCTACWPPCTMAPVYGYTHRGVVV